MLGDNDAICCAPPRLALRISPEASGGVCDALGIADQSIDYSADADADAPLVGWLVGSLRGAEGAARGTLCGHLERFLPCGRGLGGRPPLAPPRGGQGTIYVPVHRASVRDDPLAAELVRVGGAELDSLARRCEDAMTGHAPVDMGELVPLVATAGCAAGSDRLALALAGCVPTLALRARPVRPLRVSAGALAASVLGAGALPPSLQAGFLSMEQSRKAVLLTVGDPAAYEVPLIGAWVSGVAHVTDAYVWAACARFLRARHVRARATPDAATRPFIVLVVLAGVDGGAARAEWYECVEDGADGARTLALEGVAVLDAGVAARGEWTELRLQTDVGMDGAAAGYGAVLPPRGAGYDTAAPHAPLLADALRGWAPAARAAPTFQKPAAEQQGGLRFAGREALARPEPAEMATPPSTWRSAVRACAAAEQPRARLDAERTLRGGHQEDDDDDDFARAIGSRAERAEPPRLQPPAQPIRGLASASYSAAAYTARDSRSAAAASEGADAASDSDVSDAASAAESDDEAEADGDFDDGCAEDAGRTAAERSAYSHEPARTQHSESDLEPVRPPPRARLEMPRAAASDADPTVALLQAQVDELARALAQMGRALVDMQLQLRDAQAAQPERQPSNRRRAGAKQLRAPSARSESASSDASSSGSDEQGSRPSSPTRHPQRRAQPAARKPAAAAVPRASTELPSASGSPAGAELLSAKRSADDDVPSPTGVEDFQVPRIKYAPWPPSDAEDDDDASSSADDLVRAAGSCGDGRMTAQPTHLTRVRSPRAPIRVAQEDDCTADETMPWGMARLSFALA